MALNCTMTRPTENTMPVSVIMPEATADKECLSRGNGNAGVGWKVCVLEPRQHHPGDEARGCI